MSDVVFITGATSGFGAACARRFARDGARLVLTGRRTDRLLALQRELDVEVHVATLDVRDRAQVDAVVAALPEPFAGVTVLLNNAGLALGLGPMQSVELDQSETMIDTNITGIVSCTRAILPGMVARNRGHVVNIGSVAASYPYPGGNVYAGTKAFVHQFSLGLRADLLRTSVRVTCIEPGLCETEFSIVRFGGDAEKAKAVYAGLTPLTADDIAETVHWCVAQPPHVNVNLVELMPVQQAWGPFALDRR
jgi:3-hydroxy acid dehydrogenase / malonic semialdehyde reductase